jgi:hypothetical protein
MLQNLTNFFNLITNRKIKTQLQDTDLIAVGTADPTWNGGYQPTAITYQDLAAQVGTGAQGPQGPIGPQGVPGPVGPAGLVWQGLWSAATTYAENDAVSFGGASYFCYNPGGVGPSPSNPTVDTANWALLASQGAIGPQGPQGIQGPAGVGSPTFYLSGLVNVNSTSDTIFGSILIPANTYSGDEAITISAQFAKIVNSYTTQTKFWINTSNSLAGATQLALTDGALSARYLSMFRTFYIDGASTHICPANINVISDNTSFGTAGQTVAINWGVNQYFIITGSVSVPGETLTFRGAKLY